MNLYRNASEIFEIVTDRNCVKKITTVLDCKSYMNYKIIKIISSNKFWLSEQDGFIFYVYNFNDFSILILWLKVITSIFLSIQLMLY